MGGIMVRYYLSQHSVLELGRVVMLGPPNAGSELVDRLSGYQLFCPDQWPRWQATRYRTLKPAQFTRASGL